MLVRRAEFFEILFPKLSRIELLLPLNQFRLLKPKIVVCLGRVAAQRMIREDFSVSREHGEFYNKNGILFMATYHPAALLRQPRSKPDAFADFLALREKIQEVCEHTY